MLYVMAEETKQNRVLIACRRYMETQAYTEELSVGTDDAICIVRPGSLVKYPEWIEQAVSHDCPVVVVAGTRDQVGQQIEKYARQYGIMESCLVWIREGEVVTGDQEVFGLAIKQTGIGASALTQIVNRAIKKQLVPEIPVWDDYEESLTEPDNKVINKKPNETQPLFSAPAKTVLSSTDETKFLHQLEMVKHLVLIIGVRSGVGTSMVAASLCGVLSDYGSGYLEITRSPVGYRFFGATVEGALANPRYNLFDGTTFKNPQLSCNILLIEPGLPEYMQLLYERAAQVVLVADGSPESLTRVEKWMQAGLPIDILVINKTGSGYPPEVYLGEYQLNNVFGVPGGPKEEMACHNAQSKGQLPLGISTDLDNALKKIGMSLLQGLGEECRNEQI